MAGQSGYRSSIPRKAGSVCGLCPQAEPARLLFLQLPPHTPGVEGGVCGGNEGSPRRILINPPQRPPFAEGKRRGTRKKRQALPVSFSWSKRPLSNSPLVGVIVLFLVRIAHFIYEVEDNVQFYNEVRTHQALQYKPLRYLKIYNSILQKGGV